MCANAGMGLLDLGQGLVVSRSGNPPYPNPLLPAGEGPSTRCDCYAAHQGVKEIGLEMAICLGNLQFGEGFREG
jgi:hypothetical protein